MVKDKDTKSMATTATYAKNRYRLIFELSDAKLNNLLTLGKQRGFIFYSDLNAVLPDAVTSDEIEDVFAILDEMGINVIESEEDDKATAKTPPGPIFESKFELKKPSSELKKLISNTLSRYPDAMPAADYRAITSALTWMDRPRFDKSLENRGYVLTDYFDGPDGRKFAAAFSVVGGDNFQLVVILGQANNLPIPPKLGPNEISSNPLQHPLKFKVPIKPDDEVWMFSEPKNSHPRHFLRGLALVRNMTVIGSYVTLRG